MATANAKVTITAAADPRWGDAVDNSQQLTVAYGTIAVDANPATYATGGVALVNASNTSLGAWNQEPIKSAPPAGKTSPQPVWVDIADVSGTGYVYTWNKANNKLQIWTSNGAAPNALLEFTNATAIPAAVSGGTLYVRAVFYRV